MQIEELSLSLESEYSDVTNLEFLASGGQKHVFKFNIEHQQFTLKCVPLFIEALSSQREEFREEIKESILARSYREIDIMNRINSPHLVKLGTIPAEIKTIHGNEYLIYSEELISGEDLSQILLRRRLSLDEVKRLGIQITSVISLLKDNDYIHRDIKPNNIMLKEDGDFVLLDAGIAFDFSSSSLTHGGFQPGTKLYMSPEQYMVRGRQIDFRSDLYSLGLVMFESLCQKHAFILPDMNYEQVLTAFERREIIELSEYADDVPADLEKIIVKRLLAVKAHKRYKSCENLIRDLREIRIESEEL